ncbi:MAG: glutathione S-transferase family protein [Rubrimonas sp.]|uniref:glutathione S-transferase family protein n=1 Tax=Rubrimonas sp. TaxID=2036015 RepID=UPI002FDC8DF5
MSLILWGRRSSANVQKVLWALAELGLPFERRVVGGQFGGVDDAAYRAMNPNALVPALQDGALTLFESDAILRHLARTRGMGTLWPADPAHAARADMWTVWASGTLNGAIAPIFFATVRKPRAEQDVAALRPAAATLAARVALLDAALAGRDWLCGDAFSFGEIAPAIFARRAANLPFGAASGANVAAWLSRMADRPGWSDWVDVPTGSCLEEWTAHEKALG